MLLSWLSFVFEDCDMLIYIKIYILSLDYTVIIDM